MGSERSRGSRPEDTALTKIFVGGLAWGTRRDGLRAHFEKFGEVEDAVVITDGITGRSRGYGFVTFKDAEAARKACEDPYPVIDERRANCNLASLGARKNRSYTLSPHPGSEKWRQRSGPQSRQKSTFNRAAPPSLHIPQSRTWEPRSYLPYQYPTFSHSLYTMNYYNTVGGQHFPTYCRPQHLNYYPLHQRPSHATPDTMHYRKSIQYPVLYGQLYMPQLSLAPNQELPLPALAAERNREEGPGATPKGTNHK